MTQLELKKPFLRANDGQKDAWRGYGDMRFVFIPEHAWRPFRTRIDFHLLGRHTAQQEEQLRNRAIREGFRVPTCGQTCGTISEDAHPGHILEHAIIARIDRRFHPSVASAGYTLHNGDIFIAPPPGIPMRQGEKLIRNATQQILKEFAGHTGKVDFSLHGYKRGLWFWKRLFGIYR